MVYPVIECGLPQTVIARPESLQLPDILCTGVLRFLLGCVQVGHSDSSSLKPAFGNVIALIGYILPFIVMIAVIAVLTLTTSLDEAVTGTIALCSIALYYLVLRLFRNRLEKQFSITARKA